MFSFCHFFYLSNTVSFFFFISNSLQDSNTVEIPTKLGTTNDTFFTKIGTHSKFTLKRGQIMLAFVEKLIKNVSFSSFLGMIFGNF